MKSKVLNVIYITDDKFSYMVGVSVASLLMHSSKDVSYNIHILAPDMSDDSKNKFESLHDMYPEMSFNLIFLDAAYCENIIKDWDVPKHRDVNVTYYRLLFEHYFEGTDVERLMLIGADTLVTGDLSELIDFDFQDKPFAMNCSGQNFCERHIPAAYNYCIAEMIFFNFPVWREMKCEERIKRHIEQIGEIYGGKDQGILNMEFYGEIAQLPLKYNLYSVTMDFSFKNKRRFVHTTMVDDDELRNAYLKPSIVHIPLTFLFRPDVEGSLDPMRERWWECCNKSPWKGRKHQIPEDMTRQAKAFRWIFKYTPKVFHDWIYIVSRQINGKYYAIKYPPLPKNERKVGL